MKVDLNEIVKIETLPKIFEQLDMISKIVDDNLEGIEDIECTEENKQQVKNKRTEINNTLKVLEDKRKEIKSAIEEPYKLFNAKYEETAKRKLENASNLLKTKIDEIENEQRKQKEEELRTFAQQWIVSKEIEDYAKFEDIGLNITLSSSIKSLKEQVVTFCERVSNDIQVINTLDDRKEILYEYKKNGLNQSLAILTVKERKEALEALKNDLEKAEEQLMQNDKVIEIIQEEEKLEQDEITTPKEIIEESEVLTVTFTITDTKENIIKVREFMKLNNISYE